MGYRLLIIKKIRKKIVIKRLEMINLEKTRTKTI